MLQANVALNISHSRSSSDSPAAAQLAPIALFAYNRPAHTHRALDALRDCPPARESDLYVYSDAPRVAEHETAVSEVRKLVKDVRGFRSVTVVEREHNLGLAASIAAGVGQLCGEHGRVIVVEDDLIVAPGFLHFMNRALERYAMEPRVMQITGYMYPGEFGGPDETLFLPMISCWGWATWQRAWQHYDPAIPGYARFAADRVARMQFDLNGAYDYTGMLERQRRGELDSWGIRWYLTVFQLNGLVLYPARSLVRNAGVDGSGTHGAGTAELQRSDFAELATEGPTSYPRALSSNARALSQIEADLRRLKPGILSRLLNSVMR